MATTGERLVELSSLLTGTALEHFLNIDPGIAEIAFDVELKEPDSIIVAEQEVTEVGVEDADFDVKIIQKETVVTKK